MGYQCTPDLRFYAIFGLRIEKMQLEVLFQFLERQFYRPPVFVYQSHFFGTDLPIVGDEFIFPACFVPVVYQTQAQCPFLLVFFVLQMDMLNFVNSIFIFFQCFFKKDLLQYGFGIVFQAAGKKVD